MVQVNKGTTCRISGTFISDDGTTLTSNPDTIVATLYELSSGTVINSRDQQNVLNVNGGTCNSGVFVLFLGASDNVILNSGRLSENHRLFLEWTYNNGTRNGNAYIDVTVIAVGR